jgi:hypothetical protein
MTRKECLDAAAGCVLKDRQNQYGGPENNFERIATMWNGYLGTNSIKPWDVAAMMGMLKMARARFNPKHADNWVDLAGYAACGVECATAQEEFDKALDEFQKKAMPAFASKAEGCEEPKFKRGDKVEVQMAPDSSTWASAAIMAVYRDKDTCEWRYCVDFEDGWAHVTVPSARVRPVSAPKVEGCEELVQKDETFDAPQTKEELIERIKSANPAIYGAHIE